MLNDMNPMSEPLILCNPGAIAPAEREAHAAVAQAIFSSSTILEIRELANGYGFRLPLEADMLHQVAAWIANERLCCPFFTFTLVVGEQFWLELSGTEAVKALIQVEILPMIETGNFPTMEALQAEYNAATGTGSSG